MTRTPPLRAVEVFEAVGRRGKVTTAAEELGISAGAVTQQIRLLEKHLGFRLLQRSGRGIELTSWGVMYLSHATAAMEQLRKGSLRLERALSSGHLSVSTFPSMANNWLGPLLFEWKKKNADGSVLLTGSDVEPQLEEGETDFRVSYGTRCRGYSRYTHLFTDFVIPVASPALLSGGASIKSPRDVLKFPLLWIDWGPEYLALPSWLDWLACADVPCEKVNRDLTFSLSSTAIEAAIDARGLVLAQHSMVRKMLATGRLVRLFDLGLPLPESYFLAWSDAALDKPMGKAFHDWLIDAAKPFSWPAGTV